MAIPILLQEKREEILRIARKHGVVQVRLFGSQARGEANPESDVDLLIEVGGTTPPWFPGGLVAELTTLLGRRVDVVELETFPPPERDRVLAEAVSL